MHFIVFICLLLFGGTGINQAFESTTVNIATITHSVSGCFSSGQDRLTLYRTDSTYFAILETSDKKRQMVTLTNEQLTSCYNFIQECKNRKMNLALCTTEEIYRIQTGEQTFIVKDGSCTWQGFNKLQRTLFPVKENE